MPGGGIQGVSGRDLLWMRYAFPSEWKGAVMVRLKADRLYSNESLDDLKVKFLHDGAQLAGLTPPEGKLEVVVNAYNVVKIMPSNNIFYHAAAKTVLDFGNKVALAVREDFDEVRKILKNASD